MPINLPTMPTSVGERCRNLPPRLHRAPYLVRTTAHIVCNPFWEIEPFQSVLDFSFLNNCIRTTVIRTSVSVVWQRINRTDRRMDNGYYGNALQCIYIYRDAELGILKNVKNTSNKKKKCHKIISLKYFQNK